MRSLLYTIPDTIAAATCNSTKRGSAHPEAARRGDDDVRAARQLARLLVHVQPAHDDHIFERHASAQRTELLRQLERQLPAG